MVSKYSDVGHRARSEMSGYQNTNSACIILSKPEDLVKKQGGACQ